MEYAPIGSVASVRSGFAFKSKDWTDAGIPVVKIANVKDGFVSLDGCSFVSDSIARAASEFELKPGDILISMTGYIGEVARVRSIGRMLLNQRVGKFRIKDPESLDGDFLFCCLRHPELKAQFAAHAYGAAQPNISPSLIEQQEIPLPPLPIQRRIAGILSAYDDLIENSQRRIKILEEMARRLYREWFVHFRFPGHEGCRFVDSPLGEIPEGWEVKTLGQIAEEVRRNVPKGSTSELRPYVGLEHIPRRSLALDAWEHITELASNKLAFKRGEILFGKIRPYFHKVCVAPFDGICSADTIVIRALRPCDYAFVVGCTSSDEFVAEASASANGAKMPRANWEVLKRFPVAIPPAGDIAEKYSSLLVEAISQQQTLVFQIQNLRRTRDLFLPRLLSGQIDVEALPEPTAEAHAICSN